MQPPSRSGSPPSADVDERSLAWAWLASLAVVATTAAALSGAYVLTPGTPECRLYASRAWVLCPWYRQYVAHAAVLFVAVAALAVIAGLLVGLVRAPLDR